MFSTSIYDTVENNNLLSEMIIASIQCIPFPFVHNSLLYSGKVHLRTCIFVKVSELKQLCSFSPPLNEPHSSTKKSPKRRSIQWIQTVLCLCEIWIYQPLIKLVKLHSSFHLKFWRHFCWTKLLPRLCIIQARSLSPMFHAKGDKLCCGKCTICQKCVL